MSGEFNSVHLASICTGLDVYRAKSRLFKMYPALSDSDIDIRYQESSVARFTVLACTYDEAQKRICLTVATSNPIRHLPLNYQSNIFLRNFLMVFQHIYNSTAVQIDNAWRLFKPMECPSFFLPVLANWLGARLETLGSEEEVRLFLQYAVNLYRLRGTALGLKAYLWIVSGIVPEILEGALPYVSYEVHEDSDVANDIFDFVKDEGCFSVYIPVHRDELPDPLVRRMSLILQQEKPAHTHCYLCFKKHVKKGRTVTTIHTDTVIDVSTGFSI